MRCCSVLCLAFYFALSASGISQAAGIEAAADAERLIAACNAENLIRVPLCLNYSLNRKWKYEWGYAGKPFSAIGRLEGLRKSLIGNVFAFVAVNRYWASCKIKREDAAKLENIVGRQVLISGVLAGYRLTFDLHRFHHLRLDPYCSIGAVS